jgi:hypothetical protein
MWYKFHSQSCCLSKLGCSGMNVIVGIFACALSSGVIASVPFIVARRNVSELSWWLVGVLGFLGAGLGNTLGSGLFPSHTDVDWGGWGFQILGAGVLVLAGTPVWNRRKRAEA